MAEGASRARRSRADERVHGGLGLCAREQWAASGEAGDGAEGAARGAEGAVASGELGGGALS
jgi:hypothetical protein